MPIYEQWANACIKAGIANHYLVYVRAPYLADYDMVIDAAQIIFARENAGTISHPIASRALILLSESSGYSLTDFGA